MRNFPLLVWKERDVYVSRCLITKVSSYGDTEIDAINHHKEAMELFLEDLPQEEIREIREIADSIPPTNSISIKTISLDRTKS